MDKKYIRLSVLGFTILVVALVGVTYAFFNYTRTGNLNNIRTGRIYFNTVEGTALNITNMFPMTSTEAEDASLDSVTLGIAGDTYYADGEEFEISLVDVTNTINGKEIPINYIATYTAANGGDIGASSDTYYTSREAKDANIYKLTTSGQVKENERVLVGFIKTGTTGVSGTLTVKAYIDADRIAISDTYNGPTATPNDNMGTTTELVNDRVVLTTAEWNSLSSSPISFKIKAVSQNGVWVPPEIASCQGCKYLYTEDYIYSTWNHGGQPATVITSGLSDNYQDVIARSGHDYFIGVKLNGNNQVTNIYACGVRNNNPYCLESSYDGSTYLSNHETLQNAWNNTCTVYNDYYVETVCESSNPQGYVYARDSGFVAVTGSGGVGFFADNFGSISIGSLD